MHPLMEMAETGAPEDIPEPPLLISLPLLVAGVALLRRRTVTAGRVR